MERGGGVADGGGGGGGGGGGALVGRRVRLCGVEVGMFLRARGVIEKKVMGVGGVEGRVTGMG